MITRSVPGARPRHALVALGFAVLVLVGGCTTTPEPATDESTAISLSFIQQRIDEGTSRAQLRVINHADQSVTVTRIGLDWSGYGRFEEPHVTTFASEQTIDLRITLPPPVCPEAPGPAYGLLELEGGTAVRERLDRAGQDFLRRIWRRACTERYVDQRVTLGYGDDWRRVGRGRSAILLGSIRVARKDTDEPIHVEEIRGSVLFAVELLRPGVLPVGASERAFPISLSPARCDEHALGQSTQTFVFRTTVRLGDSNPMTVLATPDRKTQAKALAFLFDACR